jgi:hypothetical protein
VERKIRIERPTAWPHHRGGWGPCVQRLQAELCTRGGTLCFDSEERLVTAWHAPIAKPFLLISHFVPHGHPRHPGWNLADFCRHPRWLACRDQCRGVITLSHYACDQARRLLGVPSDSVLHAAEPGPVLFTMDRFLSAAPRSLLMVGWWMRRFATFCHLRAPGYVKRLLPGISSAQALERAFTWERCLEPARRCLMPHLAAGDYDALLARSVVFLDLFDASANNAVIECIARRTPLLVRRLPAVVEYLGEDYPFFFDCPEEAEWKLTDPRLVYAAHEHLCRAGAGSRVSLRHFAAKFSATSVYGAISGPQA